MKMIWGIFKRDMCHATRNVIAGIPMAANGDYAGVPLLGLLSPFTLVAGLLGLFLGTLGVHNFYLGYTGKAVAQLLLTLIGWIILIGPIISGIWALIEAVLILCSSYGSNWHRDGRGQELQD